jgi:hypothetical protein
MVAAKRHIFRPLKWPALFVAGLLSGLLPWLLGYRVAGEAKQPVVDAGSSAVETFVAWAVAAQRAGQRDKAEYLEQDLLNLVVARPDKLPQMWPLLKQQLERGSDGSAGKIARLVSFKKTVEAALMATREPADFEAVWRVRLDVAKMLDAESRALAADLVKRIELLRKQVDVTTTFAEAAEVLRRENEPQSVSGASAATPETLEFTLSLCFGTLVAVPTSGPATSPATGATSPQNDAVVANWNKVLKLMLDRAESDVAQLRKQLKDQADLDRKPEGVGPTDLSSSGAYEVIATAAVRLEGELAAADLGRWSTFGNDRTVAIRIDDSHSHLSEVAAEASQLQQSRYNLWALRQISAAEDVPNWPERLGQVDVHLLHPTVSALYAMAYENRLKSLDDPSARPQVVRRLINQLNVRQERF